ncbi:alpha/beta hydrolase [Synechococcus sp. CS-1329]|uniref:alpha/beta hydrolase n=1 Tax=Synechococcus sp. CS-1329 TaxID=2847975 RepID=UPI00223B1E23|nr:alpha/beta hydrolase [Synechococcus sp. CS-1329]MCT0218794.1 alpha/beta hydrolase [Synechococcus sp. CS-1329]
MARSPKLLAVLLGLSLSAVTPGLQAQAAQQVVFVSGAFRRSIPVADLEHLAQTGEARGLLGDVMRFSNQDPASVSKLLNQQLSLPLVLTSRLLSTRIGEALLQRLATIFSPLRAPQMGVQAIRGALITGLANGNGNLSATGFLQAYPAQELAVNIPALLGVMSKANSISDLVRFFSESPLDGLRGDSAAPPEAAPTPEAPVTTP